MRAPHLLAKWTASLLLLQSAAASVIRADAAKPRQAVELQRRVLGEKLPPPPPSIIEDPVAPPVPTSPRPASPQRPPAANGASSGSGAAGGQDSHVFHEIDTPTTSKPVGNGGSQIGNPDDVYKGLPDPKAPTTANRGPLINDLDRNSGVSRPSNPTEYYDVNKGSQSPGASRPSSPTEYYNSNKGLQSPTSSPSGSSAGGDDVVDSSPRPVRPARPPPRIKSNRVLRPAPPTPQINPNKEFRTGPYATDGNTYYEIDTPTTSKPVGNGGSQIGNPDDVYKGLPDPKAPTTADRGPLINDLDRNSGVSRPSNPTEYYDVNKGSQSPGASRPSSPTEYYNSNKGLQSPTGSLSGSSAGGDDIVDSSPRPVRPARPPPRIESNRVLRPAPPTPQIDPNKEFRTGPYATDGNTYYEIDTPTTSKPSGSGSGGYDVVKGPARPVSDSSGGRVSPPPPGDPNEVFRTGPYATDGGTYHEIDTPSTSQPSGSGSTSDGRPGEGGARPGEETGARPKTKTDPAKPKKKKWFIRRC